MPGTLWSAPSSTQSSTSLAVSVFTTSPVINDISPPGMCFIGASTLNMGTRIRLHAVGEYTATTTASNLTWGFYLSTVGTGLVAASSAALATTASTAAVVATAWPFILDYSGVVQGLSVDPSVNNTGGKIVGQGWSLLPLSLNSFTGPIPMPTTAAARTVVQSAAITGLNTETNLFASVGLTVATNTGFTSATCDELTCELIG